MPAGLTISSDRINEFLADRQRGYGRGGRMKIESDRIDITGGVRQGVTLGSPIGFSILNRDFSNWAEIMSPEPTFDQPPEALPLKLRPKHTPRPGHADLAGAHKYGSSDMRNVLERASARETAARVAACAFPRLLLEALDIEFCSHVVQIGSVSLEGTATFEQIASDAPRSDMRCIDEKTAARMRAEVDRAREDGDTVGGRVEYRVRNVPVGVGRYSQGMLRLSSRLAAALMSIPACKGVEVGDGFELAGRYGSKAHDEIVYEKNAAAGDRRFGFRRLSNRAGGLEGGMANGEEIVLRVAAKPLSTLMQPLQSVNVRTLKSSPALVERSDVCAVPPYCVIGEMLIAWVIADVMLEKFGSDSLIEIKKHLAAYLEQSTAAPPDKN